MPYGRYSTIHEHRWLRNVDEVEKDVFLFSTTRVVCVPRRLRLRSQYALDYCFGVY